MRFRQHLYLLLPGHTRQAEADADAEVFVSWPTLNASEHD